MHACLAIERASFEVHDESKITVRHKTTTVKNDVFPPMADNCFIINLYLNLLFPGIQMEFL